MHTSSRFRKPSSPLKQQKNPRVYNFTRVRTDMFHKSGGGLITLNRDNITFTTTDIPSIINTHTPETQMDWSRYVLTTHNTSVLQTCIYLKHSTLSGSTGTLMTTEGGQPIADAISNSDHVTNTKHRHTNQRVIHHTTTNNFPRYHHGVEHTIPLDIVDNSTCTIIRPPTHHHSL